MVELFAERHIGVNDTDINRMLSELGYGSLSELTTEALPNQLAVEHELSLPPPMTETQLLAEVRAIAATNRRAKNYIGLGYSPVTTPAVIARNILEDPRWYTAYTPYQAEVAQGRLEALINFQQMIIDLTALDIANASLLDEGSALAEAMNMAFTFHKRKRTRLFVSQDLYPQSLAVLKTRAEPLGIELVVGDQLTIDDSFCAGIVQYPNAYGDIPDLQQFSDECRVHGALAIAAADIMSLLLLPAPGKCGIDIAVGSTQRFGVPLFYGGPHAAYLATRTVLLRTVPGRLIGVSRDLRGNTAYRMALQTREQHIRREKATSNICTAQVLLAVMASFYAVYHGRDRLIAKAKKLRLSTSILRRALEEGGYTIVNAKHFDTLTVETDRQQQIIAQAQRQHINFRIDLPGKIGISINELTTDDDLREIAELFVDDEIDWRKLSDRVRDESKNEPCRTPDFLNHPVFRDYQTETEFVRYVNRLVSKDLSLVHSMIPLGSCTMKLNSAVELLPVSWPEFSDLHPFAPADQTAGYRRIITELEQMLATISGFSAVSLQPNAGSQGELAGLLAIRRFHADRHDNGRTICLVPGSAHGTNPASAVMAGFKVVAVACDSEGAIDLDDLTNKAQQHRQQLGALMITYPSTHGVFDDNIAEVCQIVHNYGGQVYLDGANMNAMVALARPADFGADVLHVNLHKTFCIPHGGGGPGVGPIAVAEHLAPYLPSTETLGGEGTVASAPYGSAGILIISWIYLRLMGADGLKRATQVAILNANYLAKRLADHYPIMFVGKNGLVAHECIIDCQAFRAAGIDVSDIARRLMDYGFHSPTMSWPVAQTLMIEPTESESKREIDRFCSAMIAIRREIRDLEKGSSSNCLTYAPHTIADCLDEEWQRSYSKQTACFPLPYLRQGKFWPAVNRVDQTYGDRNFSCGCV